MRARINFSILVLGLVLSGPALAQELRIGIAAPVSGTLQILGNQLRAGAEAAAASQTEPIAIDTEDTACTAEGGAEAARRFVAAQVQAVVGFLCTPAIEAALPIFRQAGVPVITPGVRTDALTDRRRKTGWPIFRLAPRADEERTATGVLLTKLWRTELFAIVDDGTIYGRELAESLRLAAEQAGLNPVFVDTFRPQLDNQIGLVGRLRKAAATHVFVGGDRSDIAIIGRDAAKLGVPLVIAGGEALRGLPGDAALPVGTLMIGLPDWDETADPQIVASLRADATVPEGYVLPAYAAMQIAVDAIREAGEGGVSGALNEQTFETAIGSVRFDAKGDLSKSRYRVLRFDGSQFVMPTSTE